MSNHTHPDEKQAANSQLAEPSSQSISDVICLVVVGAIFGLVWWLGWLGILLLVLWSLTAAMAFSAVYTAWNAFSTEDVHRRSHLRLVAAGLAVVSLIAYWALTSVPSSTPVPKVARSGSETTETFVAKSPSKEAIATLRYWTNVRVTIASLDAIPKCAASQTPADLISHLEATSDSCSVAAERISKLPVRDVDADVIDLGANYLQLFQRVGACLGQLRTILSSQRNLEKYANSLEALFESALCGVLGDPLGKYNDLQQSNFQLGADFRETYRELQRLVNVAADLRADAHRLRGKMSSKHELDFPEIE